MTPTAAFFLLVLRLFNNNAMTDTQDKDPLESPTASPGKPTDAAAAPTSLKGKMSTVSTTTNSSINTTAANHSNDNDAEPGEGDDTLLDPARILARVDQLIEGECLLAAARLLRQLQASQKHESLLLTPEHQQVLAVADDMEASCADLLEEPDASWTKQSETKAVANDEVGDSHSHRKKKRHQRDTVIHYKVDGARLECRVDCVVEASLLVPFLAVLNETNLYATWIPSWTVPVRLGVKESKQLKQVSRGHQIVHVTCNVPWPIYPRDVVLRATACDDIEAHNAIVVRMKGIQKEDDDCVPEVLSSVVRADFEGAILIRPCPESKWPSRRSSNPNNPDQEDNHVLVSFKMFMDPHLSAIPISVINFVTRTVIHTMWNMLLHVAEDVRDGKRPQHAAAIKEKPDLYEWINTRIGVLLGQMENKEDNNNDNNKGTKESAHSESARDDWSHDQIAHLQT